MRTYLVQLFDSMQIWKKMYYSYNHTIHRLPIKNKNSKLCRYIYALSELSLTFDYLFQYPSKNM